MPASYTLVYLLGCAALLLWGVRMVHTGVLRAYGTVLHRVVGRALGNRASAFLTGLGVTSVLQSSTATGLMATSFAARGVIDLTAGLAVMLGANVGSALIVAVLAFDVSLAFPILLLGGMVAFRAGGRSRTRDLGRAAIGLGLMLLALHLLVEAAAPGDISPSARALIDTLTRDPILDLLLAALIAWAAHSSVATVLVIMSLAATGTLPPLAALAMVLGANLGSALNPVIEGLGADRAKLRLPLGNLANRLVGCALALPLLPWIVPMLEGWGITPARMTADFHLAFNLALAAAFIVPLPALSRLLTAWLPSATRTPEEGAPLHLDPSALDTPAVALANAARETLRMAGVIEAMLRGSQALWRSGDRRRAAEISRMDNVADKLHRAIERYLARISQDALSEPDNRRITAILQFGLNLEHVGDIIDRNLMELAAKLFKSGAVLPPELLTELDDLHHKVLDDLALAIAVFMRSDTHAARQLLERKRAFGQIERDAAERHFLSIRNGDLRRASAANLYLDILRDLKRIDSHLAAVSYAVLAEAEAAAS